jgi:CHASE1-domain containing sensor protein
MLGQSLNEICKLPQYPTKTTVFTWLHNNSTFLDQYRHAREVQQESHLDEMLEIADDASNDWMERTGSAGESKGWQLNGEHVNRSKLRIDARKWIMERMAPKQFGNKQQVDHTSSDGSMKPPAPVYTVKGE